MLFKLYDFAPCNCFPYFLVVLPYNGSGAGMAYSTAFALALQLESGNKVKLFLKQISGLFPFSLDCVMEGCLSTQNRLPSNQIKMRKAI